MNRHPRILPGLLLATCLGPAVMAQSGGDDALPGDPGDFLGFSIDADRGRLIAGAPQFLGGNGKAVVFRLSGDAWLEEAVLVASEAQPGDRAGLSVAIDGEVAVVGAPGARLFEPGQGAAFVFTCDTRGWTQAARLVPDDPGSCLHFGHSVDVFGETVVVGAPALVDDGFASCVYVFERAASGWSQTARITAPDPADAVFFGKDIALSGEALLVGGGRLGHVVERTGSGWQPTATLASRGGTAVSVALEGQTAVIGSRQTPALVSLFTRTCASWTLTAELTLPCSEDSECTPSLDLDGGQLLVGHATGAGPVRLFEQSAGAWVQAGVFAWTGAEQIDEFGSSIVVEDGLVVVGAPWADAAGAAGSCEGLALVLGRPTTRLASYAPLGDRR